MARWCLEHQDRDESPGIRHYFWATMTPEGDVDEETHGVRQAVLIADKLLAVFGVTHAVDKGWELMKDGSYLRRYRRALWVPPETEWNVFGVRLWITDERSKNAHSDVFAEYRKEIVESKLG